MSRQPGPRPALSGLNAQVATTFVINKMLEFFEMRDPAYEVKELLTQISRSPDFAHLALDQRDPFGRDVVTLAVQLDLRFLERPYPDPLFTQAILARCGYQFRMGAQIAHIAESFDKLFQDNATRPLCVYERVYRLIEVLLRHPEAKANDPIALPGTSETDTEIRTIIPLACILAAPCNTAEIYTIILKCCELLITHPSFDASDLHARNISRIMRYIHPHLSRIRRYDPGTVPCFPVKIMDMLLSRGLSPDTSFVFEGRKLTLVAFAIGEALPSETITVLLRNGANPNRQDQRGQSYLHVAVLRENLDALRVLLVEGIPRGLDPWLVNIKGYTALDQARTARGMTEERLRYDGYFNLLRIACNEFQPFLDSMLHELDAYLLRDCSDIVISYVAGGEGAISRRRRPRPARENGDAESGPFGEPDADPLKKKSKPNKAPGAVPSDGSV